MTTTDNYTEKMGFTVALGLTTTGVTTIEPGDIQQLYFIEDIFSYCMAGKMVFDDKFGLVENGPFTGNERLILLYGVREYRRIVFDIIKFEKMTMVSSSMSEKRFQTVIYFVDTTYKYFTKRRYSRSWDNTKNKDILDHILHKWCEGHENEKILLKRYDDSDTKSTFISPYWTPIECISWINKRTTPKPSSAIGNDIPGYLYYNNTFWNGSETYNKDNNFSAAWKSLNNLFGEPVNKKSDWVDSENVLVFFGGMKETTSDVLNVDDPMYVGKILDWKYSGIDFINIKKIQGSNVLGYNFNGKDLIRRTYKYSKKNDTESVDKEMIGTITGLGNSSLFPDISDKNSEIILTSLDNKNDIDSKYYNEWLRNYSKQQSLSVIVRGWEGRFAGMMIKDVMWQSFDDTNRAGNKNLIGPYLIKSITHNFGTKQGYTQRLVLLKNAYYKTDCDSLIEFTNKNCDAGGSVLRSS
jgi:hypothetical protein